MKDEGIESSYAVWTDRFPALECFHSITDGAFACVHGVCIVLFNGTYIALKEENMNAHCNQA